MTDIRKRINGEVIALLKEWLHSLREFKKDDNNFRTGY
jgi:hypothetical protein